MDAIGKDESRLEQVIDRMVSQRACLDYAARATRGMAGPILELGLGNGRTYDHLREAAPEREIYAFDRKRVSHPESTPPEDRFFLGDVRETLPLALERLGPSASLIHVDLRGSSAESDEAFLRLVSSLVERLIAPSGFVVTSEPMGFDGLEELDLPAEATAGEFFIYRRPEAP